LIFDKLDIALSIRLTVPNEVDNVYASKSIAKKRGTHHMLPPFQNETFVDFSNERNAAVMREAIANVESQFGRGWASCGTE